MKRLTKTKSQEILDTRSVSVSPPNSTGIMSKMKKVLGSYGSSPLEKRRAQSLEVLGNGPTFGVPLEDLLSVEPTYNVVAKGRKRSLQHPIQTAQTTRTIPFIVSKIIEYIEQNGLKQEGIYRVNGNARAMDCLKVSFDKLGDADFTNEDIFSVGGVLKLFLRELPVSLIPEHVIDEIVELQEDKGVSNGLSELRLIIQSLPQAHYDLLKALCKHLLNLSQFSDKNKMTPVSLSIVFGPSVMKCGGGLGGLKKQGNANAAFSKMIQNYSTVFEDESVLLDILPGQSSDGSFGSRFRKIRKKPKRPDPYHKHLQQKLEGQNMEEVAKSSDSSLDKHDSHGNRIVGSEMDEAIDEAFEAVIREDIEAGTRKQQRKSEGWLATPIALPKPKGLFQSDDLTARVASPYSWKSSNSAGTSPTTSPAISPRTSQVFTTLIGDSVQDHLFETQVVTTSFPNTSTEKDPINTGGPSISHTTTLKSITHSNQAINDDGTSQPAVVRRAVTRGSQNRKSAVYGSAIQSTQDDLASKRKFTSVGDLNVELLTVNNSGKHSERSDDGVTLRTGTVSNIVKQLSEENSSRKEPEFKTKEPKFPRSKEKHDETSSDLKINVEPPSNLVEITKKKQTVPPHSETSSTQSEAENVTGIVLNTVQGDDKCNGNNELDYVTRTSQSLFHPTLQRIRVPFKRAKPSRRSMLLRKATEKHSRIEESRDSRNVLEPSDNGEVTAGKKPSFQKQSRNISVSSFASVSSVSRIGSLSSPTEITPETSPSHNILAQNVSVMQTIIDTEGIDEGSHDGNKALVHTSSKELSQTGVAPEERPAISKAWSKGDLEKDLSVDISTMSYEELLRLAQRLRSATREFESEFLKQFKRKPSMQEQQSIGKQAQLLATVKRKLKEMRASDGHLCNTIPTSIGKISRRKTETELLSSSATKLDQPSPNLEKKSTHLSRHQSLLIKPVSDSETEKERSVNWLVKVSKKMLATLSERREIADRPEDLNMMTYEQLLDEKQTVQRLLLNFERKYKRPQTKEEKDVMRPVYDRYREIKRQLVNYGSKRKSLNLTKTEDTCIASTEDTTLESVSILQASQSSNYRSATSDSLAFSHGPSAFVLPLSPDKDSNHKHKKSSSSFAIVPTSVLRSQLSMDDSSPILANASSNDHTVEAAGIGGNFMSSEELKAASISELNCQLALLVTRKKQLRKELRQFEHEFEEKNKRLLTKDDKKLKFQQYVDYRDVKSRITEISELLTAT